MLQDTLSQNIKNKNDKNFFLLSYFLYEPDYTFNRVHLHTHAHVYVLTEWKRAPHIIQRYMQAL